MVDLYFYLADLTSTPLDADYVRITPVVYPTVEGEYIIAGDAVSKQPTNGEVVFTNLYDGAYSADIHGPTIVTNLLLYISSSVSGSINAKDYIVSSISGSEGLVTYNLNTSYVTSEVDLYFYLKNITSEPLDDADYVKLTPKNYPIVHNSDIITADSGKQVPNVDGRAVFYKLIPNHYGVEIFGPKAKTKFDIFISSSYTGSLNAKFCIVTSVSSSNAGGLAYSMASSDARYVNKSGSIDSASYAAFAVVAESASYATQAWSASWAPPVPSVSSSYSDYALNAKSASYSPAPRLDQVLSPTADTNLTMSGNHLQLTYTIPVTDAGVDGAFEVQGIGAFEGDLVHIHQHSDNPSALVDLLHIEGSSVNALPIRITSGHTASIEVNKPIQILPATSLAPLTLNSNAKVMVPNLWAETASYAANGGGSGISNGGSYNISASWASASLSSSFAPVQPSYSSSVSVQMGTKQNTLTNVGTYLITSSVAISASYASNGGGTGVTSGGSYNISASYASSSLSASYAPFTQTYQANTTSASYASASTTAGTATTATTATNLGLTAYNISVTYASQSRLSVSSSYASSSLSASYAPFVQVYQSNTTSASYASSSFSASYAYSSSFALRTVTASYSEYISYNVTQSLTLINSASWASASLSSSYSTLARSASYYPAQVYQVDTTSASYASSSTTAGTATTATTATNLGLTAYNISVTFASQSRLSVSSSYASSSLSASYAPFTQVYQANTTSASYASSSLSASYAPFVQTYQANTTSASYASASTTAGTATTATTATNLGLTAYNISVTQASQSVWATSASYASGSTTAVTATNLGLTAYNISVTQASQSRWSVSSSYASSSLSASYAPFVETYQANTTSASYASASTTAGTAATATTATTATNLGLTAYNISVTYASQSRLSVSSSYASSSLSASYAPFVQVYQANTTSASYASSSLSASYAPFTQTYQSNTVSASYASSSFSSSYTLSASYALNGGGAGVTSGGSYNISASYASQSLSASYAPTGTAELPVGSTQQITASWAISASYAPFTQTYQANTTSASYASSSLSASYAPFVQVYQANTTSASYASSSLSASYAPFVETYQVNTTSASYASASTTAGTATTATTATNLGLTAYNISVTFASQSRWAVSSSYASSSLSASWAPSTPSATATSASWASSSLSSSFVPLDYRFNNLTASFGLLIGPDSDNNAMLYVSASTKSTRKLMEVDTFAGEEVFEINASGSVYAPRLTGSLQGTASYALTASYAIKPTGQIFLSAGGLVPSLTNGCSVNTQVESATYDVNMYMLDFSASAYKYAEATTAMPYDWNGGTVTAKFFWTANSTSTNRAAWGLQGRSYGDAETIDQDWGTHKSASQLNTSTANQLHITENTPAITLAGTPAASELVQFRVFRSGSGGDNLVAYTRLIGVMIDYTRV